MPVRPGAGTAAPGLEAEQVAEQADDEVVVQDPAVAVDAERHDRQSRRVEVAQDLDGRVAAPPFAGTPPPEVFSLGDEIGSDGLLERDHDTGPNRLDDRRRAALLAGDRIVDVERAGRVDKRDRSAAGDGRHRAGHQIPAYDEDAGRLRPADELVRREDDGVLPVAPAGTARGHVDRHVRRGRRVVPHRERSVLVQHVGDLAVSDRIPVTLEASGERTDHLRAIRELGQPRAQIDDVDVTVIVLADRDDVGGGLAPWQFVRVVLERSDQDDGRVAAMRGHGSRR